MTVSSIKIEDNMIIKKELGREAMQECS